MVSRPGISVCPCPPGYCPSVFTRVVSHVGSAPVSHQGTAPVSHPHLHSAHYLLHSSHSLHRSGGHHHKANRGDDRQTLTQKSSTKSATIRANKSYDRISPTKNISYKSCLVSGRGQIKTCPCLVFTMGEKEKAFHWNEHLKCWLR